MLTPNDIPRFFEWFENRYANEIVAAFLSNQYAFSFDVRSYYFTPEGKQFTGVLKVFDAMPKDLGSEVEVVRQWHYNNVLWFFYKPDEKRKFHAYVEFLDEWRDKVYVDFDSPVLVTQQKAHDIQIVDPSEVTF